MTTGTFSSAEWRQLLAAPQLIQQLLAAAGQGAWAQGIEVQAVKDYLSRHPSRSALIQSLITQLKEANVQLPARPEDALKMLQQVGAMLETRLDESEAKAVREFLVGVGQAVAQATSAQARSAGRPVSDTEATTLTAISGALKATEADDRRRQQAALAAQARQREADAFERQDKVLGAAPRPAAQPAETVYVVKAGDTLSGIAKSLLGNAARWPEIFEANKDVIQNPNLIRPGWKLRIPR